MKFAPSMRALATASALACTASALPSSAQAPSPVRGPGSAALAGPFCSGDGSAGSCPCTNVGLLGKGCDNSSSTGGALLVDSGTTRPDTIQLTSSDEIATSLTILFQGSAAIAPAHYGDGLRCVGGNLLRLYAGNAAGGTFMAPIAGQPSVSERSAALGDPIAPGSLRLYQAYYRDPVLAFCPSPQGDGWNSSNGVVIPW